MGLGARALVYSSSNRAVRWTPELTPRTAQSPQLSVGLNPGLRSFAKARCFSGRFSCWEEAAAVC